MNTQVKGQVEEILEESEPAWRPVSRLFENVPMWTL
jgi:hypothetical protein